MRRLALLLVVLAACGSASDDTTLPPTPTSTASPAAEVPTTVPAPASTTDAPTTDAPTTTPPSTMPPATTTSQQSGHTIGVAYAGGEVTIEGELEIRQGADVIITITSDVADEAHLHGYDIYAELAPGEPSTIEFAATRQGIFELELEDARLPLLEIEVR